MFRGLLYSLCLLLIGSAYAAEPVPEFRLLDVSSTSPRRGTTISPRDYVMQVSGYYFGEAT